MYQPTGHASTQAVTISVKNSFESNIKMLNEEAPKILRILISFLLPAATKESKPYTPRHPINTAMAVTTLSRLLMRISF